MVKLTLPQLEVGMTVITPASNIPHLTEDKKYIIQAVEPDWIFIEDDTGEKHHYHSHLFIEANVYYNMIMWLSMMRLFEIDPKDM